MFKVNLPPMLRSPRLHKAKKIFMASFLALCLLLLFAIPSVTLAQPVDLGLNAAAGIGLGSTDLKVVIVNIIRIILGFLGVLTVALIIYGGFVWMTAGGDESKVERAKKILVDAIIGLIIILAAFIIVSFILGKFTGGGDGSNPPPCTNCDPIGPTSSGPIESTYPANGQKEVAINTMIFVTFKRDVDPATICEEPVAGKCNGSKMKNVDICQFDQLTKACNTSTQPFSAASFENTIVSNNDNKTFGFLTLDASGGRNYLGFEDFQDRDFRVTLKSGIQAVGETQSIFKGHYANSQYTWQFTTNGELDLDPPEIQSTNVIINNGYSAVGGVYPGPDDNADLYVQASAPTPTTFTFQRDNAVPINLNVTANTFAITPGIGNKTNITVSVTGTYGGVHNGKFHVYTTNGAVRAGVAFTADPANAANDYASETDYRGANTIDIGPYGLTFNITGGRDSLAGTPNNWDFDVTASVTGDRVELLKSGRVLKTYVLGRDILPANVTTIGIRDKILADNPTLFESCGTDCVKTKTTGQASAGYSFKFLNRDTTDASHAFSATVGLGENTQMNINTQDKRDAYRNTIYQINFNEAINPLEMERILVAYSKSSTAGDLVPLAKSDIQYTVSNAYRTVELRGNIECGLNACGDKIYCWPVNDQLMAHPEDYANKATKYELSMPAASVQTCKVASEGWCTTWGGTCALNALCRKTVTNQQVFHPETAAICTEAVGGWCKAWGGTGATCDADGKCVTTVASQEVLYPTVDFAHVDGLTDMTLNSFNGSFNYYKDSARGKYYSIANGPGVASDPHSINNLNPANPHYNPSDPSNGGYGDNFKWSFYISDIIDLQSPLLRSLNPIGDTAMSDDSTPINFTFDRRMRGPTLQGGYGYGQTAKEQSKRYLLLDPVTIGARPIGYRVVSDYPDTDGDGEGNYTSSDLVDHGRFQNNFQYSALGGSGVESITQNCFLPGSGPREAGKPYGSEQGNACSYTNQSGEITTGCVTDPGIPQENRVMKTNPASWASMECRQIVGTQVCSASQDCKVSYYDANNTSTGSWVITKDHLTVTDLTTGRTGCCFGKCVKQ